jgi:hypothetical protein
MKERPILFNSEMVNAILEDRKTQTRRVVKAPVLIGNDHFRWSAKHIGLSLWKFATNNYPTVAGSFEIKCPYGQPGDRLWVRETWKPDWEEETGCRGIYYKADGKYDYPFTVEEWQNLTENHFDGSWKPSIHMPRWASRITLEITDVRVERVQDISNNDADAEGTPDLRTIENNWDLRDCFRELWDSINAKRSFGWEKNPWVWVVEFERVEGGEG